MAAASDGAPPGKHFGARRFQSRCEPEQDSADRGRSQSEPQHAKVDSGRRQPRNAFRRDGREHAQQSKCQPAPRRAADRREQQTFRQSLPDQPPRPAPMAARTARSRRRPAERTSSRLATFAHAISSTESTEASRIHDANRESWVCRSRSGRTRSLTSLRKPGGTSFIDRSKSGCKAAGSLRDGDPGLQPSGSPEQGRIAAGTLLGFVERLRYEQIGRREVRHFEGGGQDADDRYGPPIECRGPAGHVGVAAEAAPPERIGDQRDARGIRPVLGAGEPAARYRLDSQGRQERCVGARAPQPDRIGFVPIAIAGTGPGTDDGERRLGIPPVEKVVAEQEFLRRNRRRHAERDQPVIVGVGKAAEEDAVHHAEDRRPAPAPSAMAKMATAANSGARSSPRMAYRRSCTQVSSCRVTCSN